MPSRCVDWHPMIWADQVAVEVWEIEKRVKKKPNKQTKKLNVLTTVVLISPDRDRHLKIENCPFERYPFLRANPDKELVLETSDFNLFTVAN